MDDSSVVIHSLPTIMLTKIRTKISVSRVTNLILPLSWFHSIVFCIDSAAHIVSREFGKSILQVIFIQVNSANISDSLIFFIRMIHIMT